MICIQNMRIASTRMHLDLMSIILIKAILARDDHVIIHQLPKGHGYDMASASMEVYFNYITGYVLWFSRNSI